MRAIVSVESTEQIAVTVAITMTLGEWKALLGQFTASHYPAWKVSGIIQSAINKVEHRLSVPTVQENV